jgi:hypothetical protein
MLFPVEITRLLLKYQLKSGAPFCTTQSPDSESNKFSVVAVYVLLTFPRKGTSVSMDRRKHDDIFFSENILNCRIFYVVYFREFFNFLLCFYYRWVNILPRHRMHEGEVSYPSFSLEKAYVSWFDFRFIKVLLLRAWTVSGAKAFVFLFNENGNDV